MFKLFVIFALLFLIGKQNGWYIRNIKSDGIYFYYTIRTWNPAYNNWDSQIASICLWKYGKDSSPY